MSEEKEKLFKKWMREVRDEVAKEEKTTSSTSEPVSETLQGHKTFAEYIECENCNPPEQHDRVKKTVLKMMGHKECKDCGNIDKKGAEYCEECGEEYGKAES